MAKLRIERLAERMLFLRERVAAVARFTRLRGGRISGMRKAATAVVFGSMFAVPQYWLWGQWDLFAVFWAATLPLVVLIPLHLCRRCRHNRCPLNRATIREC